MRLGTIVSSRSHIDLFCQLAPMASDAGTSPAGAFGSFVRVGEAAVGVVIATLHQPPETGGGTATTLANVLLVGTWDEAGGRQGVPTALVPLHAEVRLMEADAIARFHRDAAGQLQIRYAPMLLTQAGSMGSALLAHLLDGLADSFPADRPRIAVLKKAVVWQSTMAAIR